MHEMQSPYNLYPATVYPNILHMWEGGKQVKEVKYQELQKTSGVKSLKTFVAMCWI